MQDMQLQDPAAQKALMPVLQGPLVGAVLWELAQLPTLAQLSLSPGKGNIH